LAIAVPEFFPKKDLRQRPSQEAGAHHEKRRVEKDSDISALQSERSEFPLMPSIDNPRV